MNYKIITTPIANEHTTETYFYYNKISNKVSKSFLKEIKNTYKSLKINPFYQIRTEKYRAIPLSKFPFLIFFEVDETKKTIKVVALFNTHQNPENYPV